MKINYNVLSITIGIMLSVWWLFAHPQVLAIIVLIVFILFVAYCIYSLADEWMNGENGGGGF